MISLWLAILTLGFLLSIVGFGLRTHNAGVVLMGIGFLAALGAVIYKAVVTFY